MWDLKKTVSVILFLGSSAALAGTMGVACVPGSATTPCAMNGWDFGAQALYLRPSYNEGWAYNNLTFNPDLNNNYYYGYKNSWDWGFKIDASYHFRTGNDLDLNWSHFSKDNNYYGQIYFLGITDDLYVNRKPQWDAVNLELGQRINFGDHQFIRFHGGLGYARIEHQFTSVFNGGGVYNDSNARFRGLGPRVGLDMSYSIAQGFGVYANTATALLVGNHKFNTTTQGVGVLSGFVTQNSGSKRLLVPEIEAKLGGTYNYVMANGNLGLDVGYMWINYFNAQHIGFTQSDFGLQGPYVGFKYIGYV